jgi:hypothetical protein
MIENVAKTRGPPAGSEPNQNRVNILRDTLKPWPAAFVQRRAVVCEVQRNTPLRQVLPYFSTRELAIESDTHWNRTRPRRLMPM